MSAARRQGGVAAVRPVYVPAGADRRGSQRLRLGRASERSWGEAIAALKVSPTVRTAFVVGVPLLLIAVTEFKFRTRESTSALDGQLDAAIIIEFGSYAAVALWMVGAMLGAPKFRLPSSVDGFMRAWVAFTLVSILWSDYPELALVRGVELVVVAMATSLVGSRANRAQFHLLVHGYVVLMTVAAFVGWRWRTPVSRLQENRFSFLSVHPVAAASMWAVAVVLAFNWAMNARRLRREPQALVWERWVHIGCLIVCSWALLQTETRGAAAAAMAGVAVTWVMSVHRRNRIPALFVAVLGCGVAAAFVLDKAVEFLVRGEGTASLSTLNNRLPLWELAMERFEERPLVGWGFGATRGIFLEELGLGGAHNAYINVLVDLGAVGAALWLGLILAMVASIAWLRRVGDIDAPVLAGLLVALLVNAVTTEGLGSGYGALTVWLLLSAAWIGICRRSHAGRTRFRRFVSAAEPVTGSVNEGPATPPLPPRERSDRR